MGDTQKRYSESFKLQVVREVETGQLCKEEARRVYGIGGNSTVLKWMKKYGSFRQKSGAVVKKKKRTQKLSAEQRELRQLRHDLKAHKATIEIYQAAMEEIEQEEGIDVKKKLLKRLGIDADHLPRPE